MWVSQQISRLPQKDGSPCHSCTMQGTRSSWTRPGQCCKMNPDRTDVWEVKSAETGMQYWNKGSWLNGAATFEKREGIRRNLKEGSRAWDREPNSRIVYQDSKINVRILWRSLSPPKRKKTAYGVRSIDVETLTILGTFARTDRSKMIVIYLNRLAPCVEAVWDDQP
jgi:hypothetical protein